MAIQGSSLAHTLKVWVQIASLAIVLTNVVLFNDAFCFAFMASTTTCSAGEGAFNQAGPRLGRLTKHRSVAVPSALTTRAVSRVCISGVATPLNALLSTLAESPSPRSSHLSRALRLPGLLLHATCALSLHRTLPAFG